MSKVTDSVIVAFSGGKESVVTLDLCSRYFKNIKAFFMYIVPDLSFQERTLEWYEKRYQIEIMRILLFIDQDHGKQRLPTQKSGAGLIRSLL